MMQLISLYIPAVSVFYLTTVDGFEMEIYREREREGERKMAKLPT